MGKLIVFEGTDGSGKSTQFRLLCQRLEEEKRPFHRLVYPRYDKPSSALLKMYLQGEFGTRPGDVNAYAASTFYAVDRYASWKQDWEGEYQSGGLFLADRYTTSNAVHQASKMPSQERESFFGWLGEFEYGRLGLPQPDLVIWLDMPTDKAVENLRRREAATHTQGDIHELDVDYLRLCRDTAQAAARFYGWKQIRCLDQVGQVRSIQDIQSEIWALVEPFIQQ